MIKQKYFFLLIAIVLGVGAIVSEASGNKSDSGGNSPFESKETTGDPGP